MIARVVEWLVRRELRSAFRRVAWVGPPPALPAGRPTVLYANHQHFHDGHLLQVLLAEALHRPGMLWMEDWDRYPLFAPLGVQPFPRGDHREAVARRRATVRRTVRRLRAEPQTVLLYFPEGRLHPPGEALLPFPERAFERLARLLPGNTCWWPVALRVAQTVEARPTALLAGGVPHDAPDGNERERLQEVLRRLEAADPAQARTLLGGARNSADRWDLSRLAPFFEQYL